MLSQFRPALMIFIVLTLITGVAYPLLVTGIAQILFPKQANGSVIERDGKAIGSALIGQSFDDPNYFWSRPSATSPQPSNGLASTGSNQGPTNPALINTVKARVKALHDADPDNKAPVPVDLVTASASGLDPDISPAAAQYQIARIAKTRGLDQETLRKLVAEHTDHRQFGVLGEPRVNVLKLNLALDALH